MSAINLGNGWSMTWVWGKEVNQNFDPMHPEPDHRPIGIILWHGDGCKSALLLDLPEAPESHLERFKVESWAPLTLTPAIECACGERGLIKGGLWLEAIL